MSIWASSFGNVIGLVLTLTVLFIAYCKWTYQYWKRKNVPYLEPQIPYGNFADRVKNKENIGPLIRRMYDQIKANGWKHAGVYMFLSPNYFVVDLEYVKNILTKDFQYFSDRNMYLNEKDDPISAGIARITGQRWKHLRAKLTPTFTSGKMKMMFQTLVDCEVSLREKIAKHCAEKKPIDIKEVLACFTTDTIGSVAFGLDCKSFEDENSPFRVYGRKLFEVTKLRKMKDLFANSFPHLARLLHVTNTPKDVADFFMKMVKDTVEYREKNNFTRNDVMQLLIDLKNEPSESGKTSLTMNDLAAQCLTFFGGGFETSSTLMTFALYELSKNREIQQKLREEINSVLRKYGDEVTYESIQDMKYLSQVLDETLRLHPPAPLTNRLCLKDYKVPNLDLVIEKGTTVIIPIIGIHYDEEYYPDPEKFDPERFTEENKSSRPSYTHLAFGEGPRICIGMRFALMQSKVGLTSLIRRFKFTVNKKTKEPLKMDPRSILISAEGGIWLDVEEV